MNLFPAMKTSDLDMHPTFAVVTLDGRRWLLPQVEVFSLESPLDIDPDVCAPHSLGALPLTGQWWPVYGLSGELEIQATLPASRRLCLLLDNGADRFGLVCDRVETLQSVPNSFPLPVCMATPDSPIQALVLLDAELGYVTTTERLAAWLFRQMESMHG